jgi:hypothetical protein
MVRLSDRAGCSLTIIAERRVAAAAQIKHLKRPEAESIGIMRELVAEFRNPVSAAEARRAPGNAT